MGDKTKGKGVKRVATCVVENGTKLWKALGEQRGSESGKG